MMALAENMVEEHYGDIIEQQCWRHKIDYKTGYAIFLLGFMGGMQVGASVIKKIEKTY